jgi:repressor LexA
MEKSNTAERLAEALKIKNIKQAELVRRTGIPKSAISSYLSGKYEPKQINISKISNALGVSESWLMGFDVEMDKPAKPDNLMALPETRKIPMLGEIACGTPKYAAQEFEYVDGPVKADFCLTARGDSMINARIYDGDIVFCHAQDSVENGEIAAVIIDDEATLKRFRQVQGAVILSAENPQYQDLVYTGEQINNIRIIGKAVSAQIKVK